MSGIPPRGFQMVPHLKLRKLQDRYRNPQYTGYSIFCHFVAKPTLLVKVEIEKLACATRNRIEKQARQKKVTPSAHLPSRVEP